MSTLTTADAVLMLVVLLGSLATGWVGAELGAWRVRRRRPTRDLLTDQPMRGPYTDASGRQWLLVRREVGFERGDQPASMRLDLLQQAQPGSKR